MPDWARILFPCGPYLAFAGSPGDAPGGEWRRRAQLCADLNEGRPEGIGCGRLRFHDESGGGASATRRTGGMTMIGIR
jgi:hypothetical protein